MPLPFTTRSPQCALHSTPNHRARARGVRSTQCLCPLLQVQRARARGVRSTQCLCPLLQTTEPELGVSVPPNAFALYSNLATEPEPLGVSVPPNAFALYSSPELEPTQAARGLLANILGCLLQGRPSFAMFESFQVPSTHGDEGYSQW